MRRLILLLVVLVWVWAPRSALAQEPIDPETTRLSSALGVARPQDAYVLLRRLWQRWEAADPVQVEAALAAAHDDPALTPPVRAYAGTLEAYARRRRGDLDGAVRMLAELGFVRDWLIVGPFDNNNRSGLGQAYLPEEELAQPVVFDRSFVGKARPVRWRQAAGSPGTPSVHRFGYLDFGAMLRPQLDICAYATTYVNAGDKPRTLSLWFGATGAFKLYLNDALVFEDTAYRQLDADRQAALVDLAPGYNRITAKVCGDETPPALALRVAEADGSPPQGVSISTSADASNAAASAMRLAAEAQKDKKGPKKGKPRQGVRGPLQRFEEEMAAAGDKASPELLESYAAYLLATGSDAEGTHTARDTARRAAEAAPTVSRLLIAAELAEDRNGQRPFVERAHELVHQPGSLSDDHEKVRALLALARLMRSGPNPREAFPIYDEVLAIAPHQPDAVLGKMDLYVAAGLPRTALALVRAAETANPSSVALLRGLSNQLRDLGRDTEAAEVEGRYAALRFDDAGFLKTQLDLAAARGDDDGVKRWSGRLLAAEPASTWAHGAVASARLKLGDPPGAIAMYDAALSVAPEDVATLRSLADLYGRLGKREKQLAHLKQILRIAPQEKTVRAYVEHLSPRGARADEKYAWPPERFLEKRAVKKGTHSLRTLRQLQVTTVYPSGLSSQFHQVVFQPLSQATAESARQFAFVYHADRQVVDLRAARVYRADGRVDEAAESGEGPADDPSINMYTLQRTFYVQFPRLNPGDVVELRYRIDDVAARNEKSDYFGEIVYMQSTEPVVDAEYVLIAPKDKKLHMTLGPEHSAAAKALKKTVTEKGDKRITRVRAQNVRGVDPEPRMPSLGELLSHVHVSSFAGWEDVGAWYWTLARDKLDVDDDVRKLALKLTKGLSTDREKVAAVYRYVANETRYVALEFGIEGIRPRRAALTLARGWGDCKDKATLIVSLLKELGIDAELVIVRTGLRGGFDQRTASLEPFDHAIAYVPSLDLYIDGTAEGAGTSELPAMDRASMGLRISGGKGKLVTLPEPDAAASEERRELSVTLDKTGDIRFKGYLQTHGVDASSWRARYRDEAQRRERVASDLAAALGPVDLMEGAIGLKVAGVDGIEDPVRVDIAGGASAHEEGSSWSVPVGPTWSLTGTFATRPSRKHDLVLGPRRVHDEVWTITLPPGSAVTSSPKQKTLTTPFGSYAISLKQEGGKLTVHSRLQLDAVRVAPSEYAAWRKFCQQVDASSDARILIRR